MGKDIEKQFKEIQKITVKDIEMMMDKWGKLELDIVSCLLCMLEQTCTFLEFLTTDMDEFNLKKILDVALMKAKEACKKMGK